MSQFPSPNQSGLGVGGRPSRGAATPRQPLADVAAPNLPTPGPNTRRVRLIDQINQLAGATAGAVGEGLRTAGIERRLDERQQQQAREQQFGEAVNRIGPMLPEALSAIASGSEPILEGENSAAAAERVVRANADGLDDEVVERLVGRFAPRVAVAFQQRLDTVVAEQKADSLEAIRGSLSETDPAELGQRLQDGTSDLDVSQDDIDNIVLMPLLNTAARAGNSTLFDAVEAQLGTRDPEAVQIARNMLDARTSQHRTDQQRAATLQIDNDIDNAKLGEGAWGEPLEVIGQYQEAGVFNEDEAEALTNKVYFARNAALQQSESDLWESRFNETFVAPALRGEGAPMQLLVGQKFGNRTITQSDVDRGVDNALENIARDKADDPDAMLDDTVNFMVANGVKDAPVLKRAMGINLSAINVDAGTVAPGVEQKYEMWRQIHGRNRNVANDQIDRTQQLLMTGIEDIQRTTAMPFNEAALLVASSLQDDNDDIPAVGFNAAMKSIPGWAKRTSNERELANMASNLATIYARGQQRSPEVAASMAWASMRDDFARIGRSRHAGAIIADGLQLDSLPGIGSNESFTSYVGGLESAAIDSMQDLSNKLAREVSYGKPDIKQGDWILRRVGSAWTLVDYKHGQPLTDEDDEWVIRLFDEDLNRMAWEPDIQQRRTGRRKAGSAYRTQKANRSFMQDVLEQSRTSGLSGATYQQPATNPLEQGS